MTTRPCLAEKLAQPKVKSPHQRDDFFFCLLEELRGEPGQAGMERPDPEAMGEASQASDWLGAEP